MPNPFSFEDLTNPPHVPDEYLSALVFVIFLGCGLIIAINPPPHLSFSWLFYTIGVLSTVIGCIFYIYGSTPCILLQIASMFALYGQSDIARFTFWYAGIIVLIIALVILVRHNTRSKQVTYFCNEAKQIINKK